MRTFYGVMFVFFCFVGLAKATYDIKTYLKERAKRNNKKDFGRKN